MTGLKLKRTGDKIWGGEGYHCIHWQAGEYFHCVLCQTEILWEEVAPARTAEGITTSSHSTLGWEVSFTMGPLGLPKVLSPSQDLQQLCNPIVVLCFIDESKGKRRMRGHRQCCIQFDKQKKGKTLETGSFLANNRTPR